jgi:putative salt-induced outer membrane protein YdiY
MKKNITGSNRPSFAAVLAAMLLIGAAVVQAAEPEAKKGWETTAAAGMTITSGTKDTLLVTAGLTTIRKWERDEAGFGISGGYGQDNNNDQKETKANTEFLQGFGQYNHLLTERFYLGARLDAISDGIQDLAYRATLTPLAGYYLIKSTNTTLAIEAGPSLVTEQYNGEDNETYLGLRFSERFEHQLTDSTKIWQNVSYVPAVDDWMGTYTVWFEVGLDTAITKDKKWKLRVVFQDIYSEAPNKPSGTDNNELRLIAGTSYSFF